MSKCYLYTALKTKSRDHDVLNGHITTSFMQIEGKMPKIRTHVEESIAIVTNIEYFNGADVTVAIVDCWLAHRDREKYEEIGITYDHEFIPHITICNGNKVYDHQTLIGKHAYVGGEYIGFVVKSDQEGNAA